jgi:hypothetical protein
VEQAGNDAGDRVGDAAPLRIIHELGPTGVAGVFWRSGAVRTPFLIRWSVWQS